LDPFTACWQGVSIGTGTIGLVTLVDVPRIGLGFVQVTKHAEAEVAAQRAAQAEVGTLSGTLILMFWSTQVGVPGAMPLVVEFFGDGCHHAACRTVTVASCGRAANDLNAFNHLWRYPA